jgi:cation diffusion facilitator family transporter
MSTPDPVGDDAQVPRAGDPGVPDDHAHEHGHAHHHDGFLAKLSHVLRPHSHDAADSVDRALEASADGIRAVKISLAGLGVTALVQLGVVLLTNSTALLADTIHNFSDALTALPLWVAFVISRRPATRRYTYGFGRAEDLAGVFIVFMIALSAVLAGWESVDRLVNGATITYPWVVAVAGVVGFAGNELVAVYRIRVGRRIGSAALVADGVHARTDGFTSLAVVVGAVGVLLGFPLADPIIGLLITVAILVVLRGAARDIYRRLMDAIDPELTEAAEESLLATPGVVAVERIRLRWIGHRIAADAGIVVPGDLDLVTAHDVANEAHHRLLHEVPKLSDVTIHVSPDTAHGADPHQTLIHHVD